VAKISFALLTMAIASTLFSVQATAQALRDPEFDLAAPFAGRPLTCLQPQRLVISKPFAERAKLKARLYNLLRESLYDNAKGIANIAREKEIKNLASKLKDDKAISQSRFASAELRLFNATAWAYSGPANEGQTCWYCVSSRPSCCFVTGGRGVIDQDQIYFSRPYTTTAFFVPM